MPDKTTIRPWVGCKWGNLRLRPGGSAGRLVEDGYRRMGAGPYDHLFCDSGAVRITGRPPDGANVMLRRTTRTV